MKKELSRILTAFLALIMMFGLCAGVYADVPETAAQPEEETEQRTEVTSEGSGALLSEAAPAVQEEESVPAEETAGEIEAPALESTTSNFTLYLGLSMEKDQYYYGRGSNTYWLYWPEKQYLITSYNNTQSTIQCTESDGYYTINCADIKTAFASEISAVEALGYTLVGWTNKFFMQSSDYTQGYNLGFVNSNAYNQGYYGFEGTFTNNRNNMTVFLQYSPNTRISKYALFYEVNANRIGDSLSVDGMPGTDIFTPKTQLAPVTGTVSAAVPYATDHQNENVKFGGWSTDPDAKKAQYKPGDPITLTETTTLYGVWGTPVTLTYNANGGSGAPEPETYYILYKTNATLVRFKLSETVPTRAGYEFLGWARNATAQRATEQPGEQTFCEYSRTIYAVWKLKSKTVSLSYDLNGGTSSAIDPTTGAITGTNTSVDVTVTSTEPTSSAGYKFLGWAESSTATAPGYAPGGTCTLTEDKTLYAVWGSPVTLNFNGNGTDSNVPSSVEGYIPLNKSPATVEIPVPSTVPTRAGYDFLGWADSSTASTPAYSYNGSVSGTLGTVTVSLGAGSKTVYAVWQEKRTQIIIYYKIGAGSGSVVSAASGTITGTATSNSLSITSDVPVPPSGYTFAGWTDTEGGEAKYSYQGSISGTAASVTLTVTDPVVTLYAVYTGDITLSFDLNGGTGTAPAGISRTIKYGGSAEFTLPGATETAGIVPPTGYTFAGWITGKNATEVQYAKDSTTPLTLSADTVLYAAYTKKAEITYSVNGTATGSDTGTYLYPATGGSVTITVPDPAVPEGFSGYSFKGWVESLTDPDTCLEQNDDAENVTKKTLYALFEKSAYISFDANGGTPEPASIDARIVLPATSVSVPLPTTAPVREGYTFLGWKPTEPPARVLLSNAPTLLSGSEETLYAPGSTYSFTAPTLLVAVYEREVTLSYDANGGSNPPAARKDKYKVPDESGVVFTITSDEPTYPGMKLLGWAADSNATAPDYTAGDKTAVCAEDMTLYAVWEKEEYTVTYKDGADGKIFADETTTGLYYGDPTPACSVAEPTREGYTFKGWSPSVSETVKGNTEYVAQWRKNTNPGTGDENSPLLWLAMIAASGGALLSAGVYGKKKKSR